MIRRFSMFWGCTIPARFPFIEKSTRLALDLLDAEVVDTDGYTCCPEGTLVKAVSEEAYYATAGRNLAVAEASSLPMVTPCNGCYSTFKSTQAEFKSDWRKRAGLNDLLAEEGLSYDGSLVVKHFMEWLHEDIGPAAVGKKVVKPLGGMRIAVHYGCHMLRPSPAIRWDSAANPTKFEDMVRALGATVVEYETKLDCCGGALDRVGQRDEALQMCRNKLVDLKSEAADALVVCCPSCFQQFDLNQATLLRQKEDLEMPVFYYTELLCLAAGPPTRGTRAVDASGPHRAVHGAVGGEGRAAAGDRAGVLPGRTAEVQRLQGLRDRLPGGQAERLVQPHHDHRGDPLRRPRRGDRARRSVEVPRLLHLLREMPQPLGHGRGVPQAQGVGYEPGAVARRGAVLVGYVRRHRCLGEPRESARLKLGLGPSPESGGAGLRRILERLQGADADAGLDAETARRRRNSGRGGCRIRRRLDAGRNDMIPHGLNRMGEADRRSAVRPYGGLTLPGSRVPDLGPRQEYTAEAEERILGGCGLMGVCDESGARMSGEFAVRSMASMHDRGNGLGGGFAGYGIYPDFPHAFCFHMLYSDDASKDDTEYYLARQFVILHHEPIPTKSVRGIQDEPILWRYFLEITDERLAETQLTAEDYVVHSVMDINTHIKGAFVASSGRNMGAFKGVGFPEEIGEFYRLDEYQGLDLDRPRPLSHEHTGLVGRGSSRSACSTTASSTTGRSAPTASTSATWKRSATAAACAPTPKWSPTSST